jgi:hypothetical protein
MIAIDKIAPRAYVSSPASFAMPWSTLTAVAVRASLATQVEVAGARACDHAWQGITPRAR